MPADFCSKPKTCPSTKSNRRTRLNHVYKTFAGLKVSNTANIFRPYCTRLLADSARRHQGEKAGGDEARVNGPSPKTSLTREKRPLLSLNANKKGVTLNLEKPQGKDSSKTHRNADVLVENNIRGYMTAWARLRRFKSQLIQTGDGSITPSGRPAL